MALSKTASQPIRKITKVGGASYSVTIPKDIVRALGWREHQKVVVTQRGQKITIEDWKE
ncbi:AbrB/MazE/SpoVT family DNA-binding domain-containing protein [Candidatus Gracilibacteria bacterium]|nr:AbrB/MazE/SpoVT family DNA-binding domain-containing protein [Candidatus Gracilibacteria bacterium]MCF7819309.1 AbrB/MazE/SpoVT family DNA-binding domain-containing protein [Candidatus Gracilibacteria bacterium]